MVAGGTRAADDDTVNPPDFPATIRLGLVFPRNETYNIDPTVMPVVLAVENAQPAFWFGFRIGWEIRGLNDTGHPVGGFEFGYMNYKARAALPPDAIGGNFVVGNSSWSHSETPRGPGRYRLSWEYKMSYCTEEPPDRLIIHGSKVHMNGTVDFTVSNTTGLPVNLTSQCPEDSGSIGIRGSSHDNTGTCMFLGTADEPDDTSDFCRLRLDQTMADCVLANITGSEDRSACEALLDRAENQDREGGGGGGGSDGDDNTASRRLFWGLSATAATAICVSGIVGLGL
jgi:hypothetical protein